MGRAASYTQDVDVALLVPVKAFTHAKQRLASVLQPDERARLARWMAARVLASPDGLPIFVACDDEDVRAWAEQQGAASGT